MPTSNKTYALLVGIDAYLSPVTALNGCRKDVERIKQFLYRFHGSGDSVTSTADTLPVEVRGDLHLCVLEDEQATYHNIIKGFREHLQQAGPDDVVWFHFSGHGMEDFTAPEFRASFEPNGKDQNLVCYATGDAEQNMLLADKELAVLLHEIATANGTSEPPHILVSLDCCHSGSGTRDVIFEEGIKERTVQLRNIKYWEDAKAAGKVRNLDTYLSGHFSKNGLGVPTSKHMLFSACSSIQTAADTYAGGAFTTSLITALENAGSELNYADLFIRIQASIRKMREEQSPQFETLGGFDPYTRFLDGRPLGTPSSYEIIHSGSEWLVKCGAIHGLPMNPTEPITVSIQTSGPENETLGIAQLSNIGAQKSSLIFEGNLSLDRDLFYQAAMKYLPLPPWMVLLRGEDEPLNRIINKWDPGMGLAWTKDQEIAPNLMLEATNEHFQIIDTQTNLPIFQDTQNEHKDNLVLGSLAKILKWNRILALHNPKSAIQDRVNLSVELMNQRGKKTFTDTDLIFKKSGGDLMENKGMLFGYFLPSVTITNTNQQLYCYLLHLRSDFSIQSYEGEVVFRPFEHPGKESVVLPLIKEHKGWGLAPDETSAVTYFKLIVTTETLNYQQLLQSKLGGDREALWSWEPMGVTDAWCSITMKLQMNRD